MLTRRAASLFGSYYDKFLKHYNRLLHQEGLGRLSRRVNPPSMLEESDYRPMLRLIHVMGSTFRLMAREAAEGQRVGMDPKVLTQIRSGYALLAKLLRGAIRGNKRTLILARKYRNEKAVLCQMVETFRTPVQNQTLRREIVVEREMMTNDEWLELFGKAKKWLRLCL